MIRQLHTINGRTTVLLGLTAENLLRLREGDPVLVTGSALGMGAPMDIFIAFESGPAVSAMVRVLVEQERITRNVIGIGIGADEIARLTAGHALRYDNSRAAMAAVLVYGDTIADALRAAERAGFQVAVAPEAAAALKPTPDAPVIIDFRRPRGQA